jgi:hypothetical protein
MNSAIRLLVLSVAAGALASSFAPTASGQTGRRGVGNSAEVERLERERRDRLEREGDLRERQFLLRSMEADRRPAERPKPRLAWAQIREDFVRLQVVNNDLARAVSRGETLDFKFVSRSAAEIRKLAGRLRDNLALPAPEGGGETARPKVGPADEQLRPALSALDALVLKFADGFASGGINLIDARSSAEARRELEEIMALSGRVKKVSERLRGGRGERRD